MTVNSLGGTSPAGGTNASGGATNTTLSTAGGLAATGGLSNVAGHATTAGTYAIAGASGGALVTGGTRAVGGTSAIGTVISTGGSTQLSATGGTMPTGGMTGLGATTSTGGSKNNGGTFSTGSLTASGGVSATGGSKPVGGTSGTGGASGSGGSNACISGPIATFSGALADGITLLDTDGNRVNAHGGGIIKVGDSYYMHGEYFLSTTTDNNFNGFSMYSSKNLMTWKNEGIVLPQQASGELGPDRKGERPHIVKCPSTGEFVLYAHAASSDYQTDKEVVYATSPTVNGKYSYKGPLTNSSGAIAAHSDMSALTDGSNAYVVTESGHLYTLSADCHSWLSDKSYSAVNGDSGGSESPTVFKAGSTYYWIGSYKTGWRANNNFYSTAPAITGPWTYQGFIAPVTDPTNDISDQRTWLSQSTWVQPIDGCKGTVYLYWGDHWYGNQDTSNPGKYNDLATYVLQPLVFNGAAISMPAYLSPWKLDVGYGTWSQ